MYDLSPILWVGSSVGRALASHASGPGFDFQPVHTFLHPDLSPDKRCETVPSRSSRPSRGPFGPDFVTQACDTPTRSAASTIAVLHMLPVYNAYHSKASSMLWQNQPHTSHHWCSQLVIAVVI